MKAIRVVALLVLLVSAAARAAAPLAIEHVTVVGLDRDGSRADQTVVVRDGRIAQVGPAAATPAPAGAQRIDGRGKFLLPGLADMHVHLNHREDLPLLVAYGVTTVRNMWGAPRHLEWRARIAAGELIGPTIYTTGPILDGAPPVHDGSFVVQTADDAARAIALHQKSGYDFVKVYGNLSAPAYAAIVAAAKKAGLPVVGHVPHAVGLDAAVAAGQRSIEHLTGALDWLLPPGSPLRGKLDPASQQQQPAAVDEARIPALARLLARHGVWSCPTRVVMNAWTYDAAETRRQLARPEMRLVPAASRAAWQPRPDNAVSLAAYRRSVQRMDALLKALRDAGAPLVVGTDTGNPLVLPGFSVHEELALLVRAGLTPTEALRAATVAPATMLHAENDFGAIRPGLRADLLLLEGDPLADIANTRHIAGVVARGRWLDAAARAKLVDEAAATLDGTRAPFAHAPPLADIANTRRIAGVVARGRWLDAAARAKLVDEAAATLDGTRAPFAHAPPLAHDGAPELDAEYATTWKDTPFGAERIVVARETDGRRVVRAQSFEPHGGRLDTLTIRIGADGLAASVLRDSDGTAGRDRLEVTRDGAHARMRATVLETPFQSEAPLAAGTLVDTTEFLAPLVQLRDRLAALAVGGTLEARTVLLLGGSQPGLQPDKLVVTRLPDGKAPLGTAQVTARRYQLTGGGPPRTYVTDDKGWPLGLELDVWGGKVQIRRVR